MQAPLAGNSVHIDKVFLQKYMPLLHAFLHFRIIDVSTVNELSKRWVPGKLNFLPRKTKKHTAMADLLESLDELRIYQQHMFGISQKGHPIFLGYQPEEHDEESSVQG
jgi:oligoribonuclease